MRLRSLGPLVVIRIRGFERRGRTTYIGDSSASLVFLTTRAYVRVVATKDFEPTGLHIRGRRVVKPKALLHPGTMPGTDVWVLVGIPFGNPGDTDLLAQSFQVRHLVLVHASLLREVATARLDPVRAVFLLRLVGLFSRRRERRLYDVVVASSCFRRGFGDFVGKRLEERWRQSLDFVREIRPTKGFSYPTTVSESSGSLERNPMCESDCWIATDFGGPVLFAVDFWAVFCSFDCVTS
ncbi:uncharacterized protein IWZ02DRAFT_126578 [Phyllosticta citriasiana]|uniref:uncharacterized protein n=1 Tax=Phyllosticta citriasiana TaxID=595635 RepID=UPI0030FD2D0A